MFAPGKPYPTHQTCNTNEADFRHSAFKLWQASASAVNGQNHKQGKEKDARGFVGEPLGFRISTSLLGRHQNMSQLLHRQ